MSGSGAAGVGEPALFRRFPALAARVPWLPLMDAATPVEPLELPGVAPLWVKRDDLTAGAYGGNKVRKLEFLLADARARRAGRLVTMGAAGSHHALATTLYGRGLGLPATLVLFPQPPTPHVRDVLLADAALGAELRWVPRMELIPAGVLIARLAHRRARCYTIAAGGSSPVGTLGYVSAALELEEQVRSGAMPAPDVVHVAAGTLGTAAGLAIGLALGELTTRVRAVRIASTLVTNERTLRLLVERTAALLQAGGVRMPTTTAILQRVELTHDAIGAGYGRETEAAREAATLLGSARLLTDPTYTAKAAAGMIPALRGSGVHLFWHTLSASEPEPPPAASTRALPRRIRRYLEQIRDE